MFKFSSSHQKQNIMWIIIRLTLEIEIWNINLLYKDIFIHSNNFHCPVK